MLHNKYWDRTETNTQYPQWKRLFSDLNELILFHLTQRRVIYTSKLYNSLHFINFLPFSQYVHIFFSKVKGSIWLNESTKCCSPCQGQVSFVTKGDSLMIEDTPKVCLFYSWPKTIGMRTQSKSTNHISFSKYILHCSSSFPCNRLLTIRFEELTISCRQWTY